MTHSDRLRQLTSIRQMKEVRASVALARGNAVLAEATAAANTATEALSQMQADLHPRLNAHLRAASVLGGAASRYAAYVLSANADRQALAQQRALTETALRAADASRQAAEVLRKRHTDALRRCDALEEVVAALTQAENRIALQREEDRQSDQRPASPPASQGGPR